MAKFEDVIKSGVCSDTGRMLLPAVPGLAVGALTSWTGPGALAAGAAVGLATSIAQQEFCDGKVDAVKAVVGGLSGGAGTGVVLVGKAAIVGAGALLSRNPDLVKKAADKLAPLVSGEVNPVPLLALGAMPTVVNKFREAASSVDIQQMELFRAGGCTKDCVNAVLSKQGE